MKWSCLVHRFTNQEAIVSHANAALAVSITPSSGLFTVTSGLGYFRWSQLTAWEIFHLVTL